jgi:hypothetical protein
MAGKDLHRMAAVWLFDSLFINTRQAGLLLKLGIGMKQFAKFSSKPINSVNPQT